jgi:hypothetical protein
MEHAIDADKAKELVGNDDALLVCAYDDEVKCKELRVEESISMTEFRAKLGDVPKSYALVFFCG